MANEQRDNSGILFVNKPKYPNQAALLVASEILGYLRPVSTRIEIAGSLRRGNELVGDVEIVFVPILGTKQNHESLLPEPILVNLADETIATLIANGILAKRLNKNGRESFGEKNKLMTYVASGIPVDLFATNLEAWWNYLVCRTGGAETNVRICMAAKHRGLKWHPYGSGFTDLQTGIRLEAHSEREVFAIAGLKFLEPWERH